MFNDLDYDSIWCNNQPIQDVLKRKNYDFKSAEISFKNLRETLLTTTCPSELRGKIWKLLLGVYQISGSSYIYLVELGPSSLDDKIRNDTFRTMTTDTKFIEHVSEDMLIRVLNAFVWTNDEKNARTSTVRKQFNCHRSKPLTYVQGMNVLAAPFLMALPEMEAFHAYSTFIWKWCPLYVQPTMRGVHCGLRLLDLCLRSLDPTLYGYLRGKNLSANTYAFASVMTFSACTPPLSELLQLWDYMFANGIHLNILFIIAQLALIRTELLASASPVKILRVLPPLRAKEIINLTNSLCKNLSPELYDKLVRHAYDERVSNQLGIRTSTCPNWSEQQDDTNDLPAYMLDAFCFTASMRSSESSEDTIDGLLAGMSRELRCSICLFNFKEATSTPCGHTFCKECITQHLLHKTSCPLCNQEMVVEDLHDAYSVQAIVKEFKKMRDQFEQERDVNLSQLPIQYLSHQDTLDQNTPRSPLKVTNSEGPLSNARELPSHAKVYLGNELEEIDIPNMTFVDKITEDTTHVVLKAANPNFRDIVEFSDQYLLGILHGCFILDSSWLEKCKEMNSVYPEARFEIAGETNFGRTGAPSKSRKNKMEGKSQKLFRGLRTKFIPDDEMSKRYERYIRIGGGTIVSHGEIIVCAQDIDSIDTDELHEHYPNSKLLFKAWIDECICAYELVKKDKYIL